MVKKEIRLQNTTQEWVAGKAGISHVVFRSAISKNNEPSASKALKIAEALGVTVEYLVTGESQQALGSADFKLLELARRHKGILYDLDCMEGGALSAMEISIHAIAEKARADKIAAGVKASAG